MKRIFIADLHIDIGEEKRLQILSDFLASEDAIIYLMGDLFNFWVGNAQGNLGYVRKFLRTIHQLVHEKKIYFLGGNRDFLFVPFFKKRLKGKVIHDGYSLQLGKNKILLYHGDGLCTGDEDYLRYKKVLQSKPIYYISRLIPSGICAKIGQKFRQKSKAAIKHKAMKTMQLDEKYIFSLLDKEQANILICGHTHKPEIKMLQQEKRIYVLPECKRYCISYLQWANNELTYQSVNYE